MAVNNSDNRQNILFIHDNICILKLIITPRSLLECQNYWTLNSYDRKTTHVTVSGNVRCDSSLKSGWYRFVGAAGNYFVGYRVTKKF